jgi:hypothetical protein
LASDHNLKDLVHEKEENDERIRELEEEFRNNKRDKKSIREFILCTEKVRKELHEMDNGYVREYTSLPIVRNTYYGTI